MNGPSGLFDYKKLKSKKVSSLSDSTKHSTDVDLAREEYKLSYERDLKAFNDATVLLGYLSRMGECKSEYDTLLCKLTEHRKSILEKHSEYMASDLRTQMVLPPVNTCMFDQGVIKFERIRDYIIYKYRKKIYKILSNDASDQSVISSIHKLLRKIEELDAHYDIKNAITSDLQKTNFKFAEAMKTFIIEL